MERAAQRDAQVPTNFSKPQGGKRQPKGTVATARSSTDEVATFYADIVNSDRYLPSNAISNTLRDAMLSRGLVTPERLRARGVW